MPASIKTSEEEAFLSQLMGANEHWGEFLWVSTYLRLDVTFVDEIWKIPETKTTYMTDELN